VGDFNGDARPDLVVPMSQSLLVFLADEDGGFEPAGTYLDDAIVKAAVVVDFGADGTQDLVVADGTHQSLVVLFGSARRT
jgi:hypothetical protein